MIWTIAKRELSTRGRSKGYIAITAVMFLAVIAAAFASTLITNNDDEPDEVSIGVVGDGVAYADGLGTATDALIPTVTTFTDSDGLTELEDGEVDVVFDGTALTWTDFPNDRLGDYVRSVVQQASIGDRASDLGLTPTDVGTLFTPVDIADIRLDGGEAESSVRFIAAGVAGLATFFLLQVWGSFVMMGVIEEKSSKVVEILLSHVRPSQLLSGKVLGLGILALIQMLIFAIGLVIALSITQDIDIPSEVWSTIPLFVATFVLGFAFYSTLFAAVGSTVSRQEDALSAQTPAMVPLFIGYFLAFASIDSPDNLAMTIGSFVPFTSPIVLPFRHALTAVPIWQILLSLLILAVSAVLMVQLAAKIYRYTLLRAGSRVKFKDAWANRNQAGLS